MMKTLSLLALAATAKLVSAHATVQAVWINDADQGTGTAIRSPPNNSPLVDVTSSDMTCNVNNKAVGTTLKVKAGDKFTFEWHHESRSASDQIIDPSHNGPVLVYIAPTTTGTAGNGWVKLAEDGFSNGQWAVERLRAAAGKHSITIPDIAAVTYLLRAEIIALHEGYRVNGAQFYMECVQIEVTSSSGSTTKTLPAGVAIPGAYSAQDPGILFDLYNSFSSYKVPGPAVWDGASLSSGGSGSSPAPSSSSSSKPVATTTTTPTAPPTAVPTTLQTSVRPATTKQPVPTSSLPPPPSSSTPTGSVAEWQQCGGINFSGSGTCASGLTCKQWNPYYFQCIKA